MENPFILCPGCLDDRTRLRAILSDILPGRQLKVNILLSAYDSGIVDEINNCNEISRVMMGRLKKILVDQQGLSTENADWAVQYWIDNYAVDVCHKQIEVVCEPPVSEKRRRRRPSAVTTSSFSSEFNSLSDEHNNVNRKQLNEYKAKELVELGRSAYRKAEYHKAVTLFMNAADLGSEEAEFYLGVCFDNGQGVELDAKKAIEWYQKSAEHGYAPAQNNMGINYLNGIGVSQDYEQALYWLKLAAEQKNENAIITIGRMYEEGIGVPCDDKLAYERYVEAANLGSSEGAYLTGASSFIGRGTQRAHEQAFKWYAIAAEKGHAKAQFELAQLYANGDGVEKNYRLAFKWFQRAADNGHHEALEVMEEFDRNLNEKGNE